MQDNAMLKAALAHTQEGVRAMQGIIRHRAAEADAGPLPAGGGHHALQGLPADLPPLPPAAELSFRHHARSQSGPPGEAGTSLFCCLMMVSAARPMRRNFLLPGALCVQLCAYMFTDYSSLHGRQLK